MNTDNDYDDDGNNIVPCPICDSAYCPSKEGGKCPEEDDFMRAVEAKNKNMTNKEELKREYQDWAVNKAKSMIPTDIIVETPDWWLSKIEQARREDNIKLFGTYFGYKIFVDETMPKNEWKMLEKQLQIIKHQDE